MKLQDQTSNTSSISYIAKLLLLLLALVAAILMNWVAFVSHSPNKKDFVYGSTVAQ